MEALVVRKGIMIAGLLEVVDGSDIVSIVGKVIALEKGEHSGLAGRGFAIGFEVVLPEPFGERLALPVTLRAFGEGAMPGGDAVATVHGRIGHHRVFGIAV